MIDLQSILACYPPQLATNAASLDKHSATPEFNKYSPMMRQCGQIKSGTF